MFKSGLNNHTDEDIAVLKYGITTVFLNLPKTIVLLVLAKKLKILKPVLLLFGFYGFIRNFSRGIHARTPLMCFITGTANSLIIAYLSRIVAIPKRVYNTIFTYCYIVYLLYAPSGTESNPIYSDQYMPLKIRSLIVLTAYYFIGKYTSGIIRNIAALSVLSQSISIIPITYKFAKQKGGVMYEE